MSTHRGRRVSVNPVSRNRWIELTQQNPDHSTWYVERFRSMAAAGDDLAGEARFIDAIDRKSVV